LDGNFGVGQTVSERVMTAQDSELTTALFADDSVDRAGIDFFKSFLSFGCAPNAKQWPRQPIEHTHDYSLAVIEFDDQGWYHDICQRKALEEFLDQKASQKEDLLIVAFIHGWKHNAAPNDTALESFRCVLRDLGCSENRRQVLGVYLGWRGLSLLGNKLWMNVSFWARKKAAGKVAVGSVREILARLRAFQTERNNSHDGEESDVGTRLCIAGHSFGGLILFTAVSEYLIESVTRTFFGSSEKHIIRPFGDLVILINPAFEAARYLPLYTAVQAKTVYAKNQRPCFLAVTATNDRATGFWFPLGRWLSTRLESVRRNALESWSSDHAKVSASSVRIPPADAQKETILKTIGHLEWLTTHRLSCSKKEAEQSAYQAYKGKGPDHPDWNTERQAFHEFNRECRPDGHLQPGWKRIYAGGAILEHCNGHPDNPFWTIEAKPEIVYGHNGIFRPVFVNFLRQVLEDRLQPISASKAGTADSDDCGHLFRLKADSDSDRSRTAFR
jgi:hypothetical protein